MKKIVFLFAGNFEIDGQMFHFEQGQSADVQDNDAERLVKGLCAEYPNTRKPAKKAVKRDDKNNQ